MVVASLDSLSVGLAAIALIIVLGSMLAELRVSRRKRTGVPPAGAVDAPDPVYSVMRWAYPGAFVAMAVEGSMSARRSAGRRRPESRLRAGEGAESVGESGRSVRAGRIACW
jgi:hypothetical protein